MSADHHSIGEVLGLLQGEFPDVTISKIRFLESQGLLAPERTTTGYRKFYRRDVGQLRWILTEQRDTQAALRVIKEQLDSNGGPSVEEFLTHYDDLCAAPAPEPAAMRPDDIDPHVTDPGAIEPGDASDDPHDQPVDGLDHASVISIDEDGMATIDSTHGLMGAGPDVWADERLTEAPRGRLGGGNASEGSGPVRPVLPPATAGTPAVAVFDQDVADLTHRTGVGGPPPAAGDHEASDDEDLVIHIEVEAEENTGSHAAVGTGTDVGPELTGDDAPEEDEHWDGSSDTEPLVDPPYAAEVAADEPLSDDAIPLLPDDEPGYDEPADDPEFENVETENIEIENIETGDTETEATETEDAALEDAERDDVASNAPAPGETNDDEAAAGGAAVSRPVIEVTEEASHEAAMPALPAFRLGDFELLPTSVSLTRSELLKASGINDQQLTDLEKFGMVTGRSIGATVFFDDDALTVSRVAARFAKHGLEARHLRSYKVAAEREAGLFEQAVMPQLRRPDGDGAGQQKLAELGALGEAMRGAMLRQALRDHLPSD